ncbi:MAG TPA: IS110 family transposase [Thermomicrobiales bacterium]|jgi:transposase
MLAIGVDAHKAVHVAVAVDATGREVARWRGANSGEGWRELAAWAAALGDARRWGIEGAWNYGRGLAQHLVDAGEAVYEVNPRWTAAGRRAARRRDKNDRLDARAVALLVWREAAALPAVVAEDDTAVLELLVTEREAALAEATRLRNQVHQLLLHLDPGYKQHLPTLTSQAGLRAVASYATTEASPVQQQRAATVRRLAQRLRLALVQAKELAVQISALAAQRYAPLAEICGVSLLTAGALAGILGPGRRFASDAQLAAYAGVAPLEASSAERVRHRLNRTGNRRLNAILYRIALTQARHSPQARDYLQRRTGEGKTKREAVRALKRFLVRALWRQWQRCLPHVAAVAVAA